MVKRLVNDAANLLEATLMLAMLAWALTQSRRSA